MDWSRKRQALIISIVVILCISFGALLVVIFSTDTPTCFDGEQNGIETGIDCGGGCALVCPFEAKSLVVSFAQYVQTDGRPDVIAHIVNPNKTADAISAAYSVEVYTEAGDLFAKHNGILDVPHQSTRAVFIPRIASISPSFARAFLTITNQVFHKAEKGPKLRVASFAWESTSATPTLTVQVVGDTEERLRRIPLTVTVFDSENTVLAVSQTIIDDIKVDEEKEIVLTWNEPFNTSPARVEFIFDTPRVYGDA